MANPLNRGLAFLYLGEGIDEKYSEIPMAGKIARRIRFRTRDDEDLGIVNK